jgi:GINS complex subunit 3
MANSRSSYYDIDAILAEEELVPCTSNFDFSYLAHLDPELHGTNKHILPAGSRIKVPLWALDKWASLDFVNLNLPRHYQRKAREKLEAAPSEVDLR